MAKRRQGHNTPAARHAVESYLRDKCDAKEPIAGYDGKLKGK